MWRYYKFQDRTVVVQNDRIASELFTCLVLRMLKLLAALHTMKELFQCNQKC
jgi:hypothetical protein